MKIYISGPMTIKKEECYNFAQFFYWQVLLEKQGYEVINPAEIDCKRMLSGWTYSEDQYEKILQEDLRLVREEANAIFMLNGWEDSEGALRELDEAEYKGIPVMYEEEWYDENRVGNKG